MTDLFLDVLNTSVSAIWVVLGVVLARLLLKKAPRWMVCSLWALVALRLIFGGFEAPFSLIPSPELIPPESLLEQAPAIHSGVPIVDNIVNPVYTESLRPAPGASINPLQVWLAVFARIWVLGMIVMGLWAVISCHRVRRQVRESIPDNGVYLCDRIGSPFIFGLFRPNIYLPSGLDEASRGHVIAHEQAHIARRDHWWKPLGFALLTVNWFNPAMWLAYLLLCRDIELACDEKVVRNYSAVEKKAYSSALLTCSINSRSITACPLAFGEVGVKQRVKSVLNYKKPTFWVILVTVVLTAVLAAGLLTDPAEQVSELRVNGALYVHTDSFDSYLPSTESIGTLRSILHNTKEAPTEEFQATNLDESLAGCPLYQDGYNIYLLKFDGSCLLFEPTEPKSSGVKRFTWDNITLEVTLPKDWEADQISGSGYVGFCFRFKEYKDGWITVKYWPNRVIMIDYAGTVKEQLFPSGLTGEVYYSQVADEWEMVYFYEDSSCMSVEKPDTYLWPGEYLDETLAVIGTIKAYKDGEPLFVKETAGGPNLGITLRASEVSRSGLKLFCSQEDSEEAWREIVTSPAWSLEKWVDDTWVNVVPEEIAWPEVLEIVPLNGTTAWNIEFERVCGYLDEGHYRIGKTFYGHPVDISSNPQTNHQTCYAEFDINPLGITLAVSDVTPNGLTLLCSVEDSSWDTITTGAPWNLERYEDGQWVGVMPESTAWTSVAYVVNRGNATRWNINWSQIIGSQKPGQYRISKHFRGEKQPPFSLGIEKEVVEQICYAEFTIDASDSTIRNDSLFSAELHQAVRNDWHSYAALSWEERMASSHLPGHCAREFDDWAAVEQFVGMKLPNPLESQGGLEKGNWAGMPVGYNGGLRFYVTFYGTRDGQVQWVKIESGYRRGELRVCAGLKLTPDSMEHPHDTEPVITADSGLEYEARTGTLNRGPIEYEIRVTGELGTGNELSALLEELLPYFEDISA